MLKVQCISREVGLYHELKLYQWYVVDEERDRWYAIPNHYTVREKSGLNNYPKKLFRTLDDRRDSKLNKLLK